MGTQLNTYGAISELILNQYYKQVRDQNANYEMRHIAEMVAQEIAFYAVADAMKNDHLGESMYANDQFIVSYNQLPLLNDTVLNKKYFALPSIPAGMPQNREVAYVGFTGNSKTQCYPMRNKDRFMQNFVRTPAWMTLYFIENGRVYFENLSPLVSGPVDTKLVGAVPLGENLVDLPLNMPKDVQAIIIDKVLHRLYMIQGKLPDKVNDAVSK